MHIETITSRRIKILDKLKNFHEYYLVGGTALALQIGHRISVDFDLFSGKEIPENFLDKVEKVFKDFKIIVKINNSEQLTVEVDGTKIDFVKYPFPLISGFMRFRGINMLKVPEIAAIKARVLGRRPNLKDYLDLYFILKEKHLTLKKIIDIAERKYKDEFDARLFLEQLIYLKDVKFLKIYFLKKKLQKFIFKNFLRKKFKK